MSSPSLELEEEDVVSDVDLKESSDGSEILKNDESSEFRGGQISSKIAQWRKISSDPWLLEAVQGVEIPFESLPFQEREPRPYKLSEVETGFVDSELVRLVKKGVIEIVEPAGGQVIADIFLRPKKDRGFRLILDLTWVNTHVKYEHFKMHSVQTALEMMRRDCYMGSIDLKDAYYSVPVAQKCRKFLRFRWGDTLFQFSVLPNGLACAPRMFTKILRPVFTELREQGAECFHYIDDSFVIADSMDRCLNTLLKLGELLRKLGFVIHPKKSVMVPTKRLLFLGYLLDSQEFRVFLTKEKEEKLVRAALDVLDKPNPKIREVAGLLGLMTAFSQAFRYAEGHSKALEMNKIAGLILVAGNYDARMCLTEEGKQDIDWWLENVRNSGKSIRELDPEIVIYTDASSEQQEAGGQKLRQKTISMS